MRLPPLWPTLPPNHFRTVPNPSSFTDCKCSTFWEPSKQKLWVSEGQQVPSSVFVSLTSTPSQLTRVLGLEVGLALQCWWQVVETQRQLPLEGRVLLAEGRESPERALTHQLLDGRVAARDGVRPARFRPLHGGRCTLRRRGGARWEGWDRRRLVWRRKWVHGHFYNVNDLLLRAFLPWPSMSLLSMCLTFNILMINSHFQLYEEYLSMCTNSKMSYYLSSCPAACHLARCCCLADCRKSWCGRSPHAQMRCDWRQRKPSRRTPSPCAASSPDRRQRHSQLHGSVSLPGGAWNSEYNLKVIYTSPGWIIFSPTYVKENWGLHTPIDIVFGCIYMIVVHVTVQIKFIHSYKIQPSQWRSD